MRDNQHQQTVSEEDDDDVRFAETPQKLNFLRFFKEQGFNKASRSNIWSLFEKMRDAIVDDDDTETFDTVLLQFGFYIKSFGFSKQKSVSILDTVRDWIEDSFSEKRDALIQELEALEQSSSSI